MAAGTDVNVKGVLGFTPLQFAAAEGHKEIAELLIAKSADVNAKGDIGDTPLHNAAFWGHKEIAEILIAEGADDSCRSYPCTSWKCGRVGQCSSKPEPSVS